MNLNEVKDLIYTVVTEYFTSATVLWAEQGNVKPKPPYVVIKFSNISREPYTVDNDTDFRKFYHCTAAMEINLYTLGESIVVRRNETGSYKNSALADLMEFSNYMESISVTDTLMKSDLSLRLISPIRDFTSLENSSSFRYRAMAEFIVYFTEEVSGMYGMTSTTTYSASGGGSMLIFDDVSSIEDVSINKED